jgi:RNA polymerase sigma factor (sigma-70 family)
MTIHHMATRKIQIQSPLQSGSGDLGAAGFYPGGPLSQGQPKLAGATDPSLDFPCSNNIAAVSTAVAAEEPDLTRWFVEEVQPHERKLRGWLRGRFPSLRDLDDLVQEAYARLFRARAAGKVVNPKTYLFATARNAALDFFRRRRVAHTEGVENIDELRVMEEGPDVAERLTRDQELEILCAAVDSLPPACRHVLVLQKIHGLTYAQIAARLGLSERTVNAHIAKGMLRCRDYMRVHCQERTNP